MRIIEKLFTTKQHGVAGYLATPERTQPGPALYLDPSQGRHGRVHQDRDAQVRQARLHDLCRQCLRAIGFPRRDPYRHRRADPGQDSRPGIHPRAHRGLAFPAQAAKRQQAERRGVRLLHGRAHRDSFRRVSAGRSAAPLSVTIPPCAMGRLQRYGRSTQARR